MMNVDERLWEKELICLQRDFHRYPELGFEEYRSANIIATYLKNLGLSVKVGLARTGVLGLLEGKNPGKTLLLRADMDALPLEELTELPHRSLHKGKMHACGHDGHMAILLTVARILSSYQGELQGNIKFLFQPNEEDAGALAMIEEGVLANPAVDAAVGFHLWSPLETHTMGIVSGPMMASSEYFKLRIMGKGGHGGAPHMAIDPVLTAAHIIQRVQSIQTRYMDVVQEPTVITFCHLQGGDFPIIIPETVELEGSIRCLHSHYKKVKARFQEIIRCECEADGAQYQLQYRCGNRLLINEAQMTEQVKKAGAQVLGDEGRIYSQVQVMLGDDFAEFSHRVPSAYFFVGGGNKAKKTDFPHHHPQFAIDEDSLPLAVKALALIARNYLSCTEDP